MKNPLLDYYNKVEGGRDLWLELNPYEHGDVRDLVKKQWEAKEYCHKKYSWAIPTEEAVQLIAQYSPIVEVGAGSGYWGWMISQVGGEIECYDDYSALIQVSKHGLWYPVEHGGYEKADTDKTLFLCWPPYDSPLAYECVEAHKGEHVVYIGEGHGGCTGDDRFHELLVESYECIESLGIPQWQGLHDYLSIWKRR